MTETPPDAAQALANLSSQIEHFETVILPMLDKAQADIASHYELRTLASELFAALDAIVTAGDSDDACGGEMFYAEAVGPPIEAARPVLAKARELLP
jgi:hypothetical protein